MRILIALVLLLLPTLAHAQQSGPYFRLRLQAAHTVPPTGYVNVWAKTSNKHVYRTDAAGTDTDLTDGGGGGAGDMVLADVQTNTGAKTFNSATLIAASPTFSGTATGTYTLGGTPTLAGTLSLAADTITIKNTAVATRGAIKSESVIAGSFTVEGNSTYTGYFDHNFNGFKIVSQEVTLRASGIGDFVTFDGVSAYPVADSTAALGKASKRWSVGYVGDVVGDQPACDATTRGGYMTIFATGGNSDTFQVCMKAAADTYAWRTVFTAP
jgi:hypothetical protein